LLTSAWQQEAAIPDPLRRTRGRTNGRFQFPDWRWRVRHRKLLTRLADAADWVEFSGTCRAFEILAGEGNVED